MDVLSNRRKAFANWSTKKYRETNKDKFSTLLPSIPNWNRRIPWERTNSALASGYGSGHKYLQPNPPQHSHQSLHPQYKKKREYASTETTSDSEKFKVTRNSHDGSKVEPFQETEIGGGGEPRAVDPPIHHVEVVGREQERFISNATQSSISNFIRTMIALVLVVVDVFVVLHRRYVYVFATIAPCRSEDHNIAVMGSQWDRSDLLSSPPPPPPLKRDARVSKPESVCRTVADSFSNFGYPVSDGTNPQPIYYFTWRIKSPEFRECRTMCRRCLWISYVVDF